MRLIPYFGLALILFLGPVAQGQEKGYPNCSEEEYLVTLDTILDHSILAILEASPIKSMDDLVNSAERQIESRERRIVPVPLCAQAISLLQQDYISGDTLGEMALSRKGIADQANPYLLRLPSREERRQANLQAVSGVETSTAPAPAGRDLPACSDRQNTTLDSLATNFRVMLSTASSPDKSDAWIEALDQVLLWRVENLSSVPECLEAIESSILLTKAASDAAASFAFRHAGVADEQNPYVTTVDESRETLRFWRQELTLTQPENNGAPLIVGPASELPPCSSAEVAYVYSAVLDDVLDVVEFSQDPASPSVMINYADAHIALRSGVLSRFPPCAELFEIGWLSNEYLDSNAGYAAHQVFGFSPARNPFGARLMAASDAFVAWSESAAAHLRAADGIEGPAPAEREVAACQPGEIAYVIAYPIAQFRSFVRAGLAIESIADNAALIEQSFDLRDRLWSGLPRCQQALEIGLLMRKIAGDWLSMQAVHNILGREDNRYAAQVQGDLDLFLEMSDAFREAAVGESLSTAAPPSLIPPERNTSLPACTDAEQVEALTHLFEALEALHGDAPKVEDVQDLLVFGRRALQIREDKLTLVKLCAENFDYVWLNIQTLNDFVTWYAMLLIGLPGKDIPLTDYMVGDLNRIFAWHDRVMEMTRDDEWDEDESAIVSDVPTCSDADLGFLFTRVLPQFQSFRDAAFAARSWAEFRVLVDELIIYRDKLRAGLPRCEEALDLGLALLKTSNDLVSMLALDFAGVAVEDMPYPEHFERNLAWVIARNDELAEAVTVAESTIDSAPTISYYVTADPYVNIRACASTSCDIVATARYGEGLTVIDDSSDWYEVRLEGGRTAFIAGFLTSKTPPDA